MKCRGDVGLGDEPGLLPSRGSDSYEVEIVALDRWQTLEYELFGGAVVADGLGSEAIFILEDLGQVDSAVSAGASWR